MGRQLKPQLTFDRAIACDRRRPATTSIALVPVAKGWAFSRDHALEHVTSAISRLCWAA